ncbi:STT3 domain-containing protein [Halobium palmae]|uniref:dolichyl-phosphooligosaccharide-protein glycotransferase n=1 Tax=Halobium palmae TaxID=1776492 RepID=A0ABD5RVR4_9EURY
MTDERTAIEDFLVDRPKYESVLRRLVERDRTEPWTFDDTSLDSGEFGELVSREFVEKTDKGYRFTDRNAIRRALEDDTTQPRIRSRSVDTSVLSDFSRPSIDRRAAVALVGTLVLLVLFRVLSLPSVFRGNDVVLTANDPYYYRYLVDRTIHGVGGGFIPETARVGEPLLVATLSVVSLLLGGSNSTAGWVLAWYPVVAAIVTGVLVYLLALRLTSDRRIGLASVAMLAIIPVHAYRTSLGFADHHAFDYVWLALTATALVYALTREVDNYRTGIFATVALGIGIAAQLLSWDAGALLVLPVGGTVALAVASIVQAEASPLSALWPVVAGTGLGTALTFLVHLGLGWQSTTMASVSAALFGATFLCVAVGELTSRRGLDSRTTLGLEAGSLLGLAGLYFVVVPSSGFRFDSGVDRLFGTAGVVEAGSMFSSDLGTIIGPLFLFGLVFVLGLPYLLWATWRSYRTHAPEWAVQAVYGWYLLMLSIVQIRFAGELSAFMAVFAGVGFVHLASKLDVTTVPTVLQSKSDRVRSADGGERTGLPMPERREALTTLGLGALVGSLSFVQTPVKMTQLTISDDQYRAAKAMQEYADNRGWEYPQNYVFSDWGHNRMYNWFVNGHSRSYAYAQEHYGAFLQSTSSEHWYRRLRDRAGFVVIEGPTGSDGKQLVSGTLQSRLQHQWGSGTSHFKAIWASEDNGRIAYTLVPGATVTGRGDPDSTVELSTDVNVSGHQFTYTQTTKTGENGWYAADVAYPGQYTGSGSTERVSEKRVLQGGIQDPTTGPAHWPLNAGRGGIAFDVRNGHHAVIEGAEWTDEGLRFDGTSRAVADEFPDPSNGFSLSVTFRTDANVDYRNEVKYPRLVSTAQSGAFNETNGLQLALYRGKILGAFGSGESAVRLEGPYVDDEQWHRATLTLSKQTASLSLDEKEIATAENAPPPAETELFAIGSPAEGGLSYKGEIKDVRLDVE